MSKVYANANATAAKHDDTQKAVKDTRDKVTQRAKRNLAETDHTPRITLEDYFPAYISEEDGDVDAYTILNAPNALALEFGHQPSGYFADTNTKAPKPEYILSKAAIGGSVS